MEAGHQEVDNYIATGQLFADRVRTGIKGERDLKKTILSRISEGDVKSKKEVGKNKISAVIHDLETDLKRYGIEAPEEISETRKIVEGAETSADAMRDLQSMIDFINIEKIASDELKKMKHGIKSKKQIDLKEPRFAEIVDGLSDRIIAEEREIFWSPFGIKTWLQKLDNDVTRRFSQVYSGVNNTFQKMFSRTSKNRRYAMRVLSKYKIADNTDMDLIYTKAREFEKTYDDLVADKGLREDALYDAHGKLIGVEDSRYWADSYEIAAEKFAKEIQITDKTGKIIKHNEETHKALVQYLSTLLEMGKTMDANASKAYKLVGQIDDKSIKKFGGDVLTTKGDLGEAFDDFSATIINFRKSANIGMLDGYVTKGGTKGVVSRGTSVLKELGWRKPDIKYFLRDITFAERSKLRRYFFDPPGKAISAVFTKVHEVQMTVQDTTRLFFETKHLEKYVDGLSGTTYYDDIDTYNRIVQKYGRNLPNSSAAGHIDVDRAASASSMINDLWKGKGFFGKLDNINEKVSLLNFANNQMAKRLHALHSMFAVSQTPYRNMKNLIAAMDNGNLQAQKTAKMIWADADDHARIATTNFIGMDQGNSLLRSKYASRWFAISFFNLWASRLMGNIIDKALDPVMKASRYAMKGDFAGSKLAIEKAFEDPELQSLLGGVVMALKGSYFINKSTHDDSQDTAWVTAGQTSLFLPFQLFPATKAILKAWQLNSAYDQFSPTVKENITSQELLSLQLGRSATAFTSSLFSQVLQPVHAFQEYRGIKNKFGDTVSTAEALKSALMVMFSAVTRETDEKISGAVDAKPLERVLASRETNFLTDLYMTPDVNDYYNMVNLTEQIIYGSRKPGLLQKPMEYLVSRLLNGGNIGKIIQNREEGTMPKELINKRLRALMSSDPNVSLMIDDPKAAYEKGLYNPKIIKTRIKSGGMTQEEAAFLAVANSLIMKPEFMYSIQGERQGLFDAMRDAYEDADIEKFNKVIKSEQMKSLMGEIGGGTLAVRFIVNGFEQELRKQRKKEAHENGEVFSSSESDGIFDEALGAVSDALGDTFIENLIETDKVLLADLIGDYTARNIGWDFGVDSKGIPKEMTDESISANAPAKAASVLAMYELRKDDYGLIDADAWMNSLTGIYASVSPENTPDGARLFTTSLLASANIINESAAPLHVKQAANQGIITANIDRFDTIMSTNAGIQWTTQELSDIAEVAKWVYDVGSTDLDGSGGKGKTAKFKQLTKKARKFIEDHKDQLPPETRVRNYSPAAKERPNLAFSRRSPKDYNFSVQDVKLTKLRDIKPTAIRTIVTEAPEVARGKPKSKRIKATKVPK
jgi:hypothetical protein